MTALVAGALAGTRPEVLVALLGVLLVLALPFVAPVTHLCLLIFATAILPYGLQNDFSIGGGSGAPGLLLADGLLFGGLLRAAIVLPRQPLGIRRLLAAGLLLAFLGLVTLQFLHGVGSGSTLSQSGFELRILFAYGAMLVAMPIAAQTAARERLLRGLLVLGLVLGLWAVAQWTLEIPESLAGDIGVREGVEFTSEGRGQIQGGLYAFPVAVVLAFAALTSGHLHTRGGRLVVLATLALNSVGMMLTYERTFWLTTPAALALVMLRAERTQRRRVLRWAPAVMVGFFLAVGVLAPSELVAAGERFASVSQHATDDSVRWRIVESGHVLKEIRTHPWVGSGLGATIYWGQPWLDVPPIADWYTHNGYLWLAWKLGVPLAALLCLLFLWAVVCRSPKAPSSLYASVRHGAQGGLLTLLLANFTFPSFNGLSITAAMGLLLALSFTRPRPARGVGLTPELSPRDG